MSVKEQLALWKWKWMPDTDVHVCVCSLPDCHRSYTVQWLEDTNLILVMAAANCECDTTEDSFPTAAREVTYILPPQNVDVTSVKSWSCSRGFLKLLFSWWWWRGRRRPRYIGLWGVSTNNNDNWIPRVNFPCRCELSVLLSKDFERSDSQPYKKQASANMIS